MTWPIPREGDVAERYAVGFEQAFASDADGRPYPETPDTRGPNTVFGVLGGVGEETHIELYLYQRSLAEELLPDTAQEWLARHCDIWGVPRLPAARAVGALVFAGAPGTALPSGIEAVAASGLRWLTVSPATIPASGAVSVPARARDAGGASNLAGGALLLLVSPVAGLGQQQAIVDAGGFRGGREEEAPEAWRARLLDRIREPPHGGSRRDYRGWAREAGAGAVEVYPSWMGLGSVGVVVAMPGPVTPTPAQIAAIAAYIDNVRPVTADVIVLAATLLPVDVQVQVSPDTVNVRAAVQAGLAAQFALDQRVGATMAQSRLSEACSSASGEYAHRLLAPAADVVPPRTHLPVLGAVTFVAGYAPRPEAL